MQKMFLGIMFFIIIAINIVFLFCCKEKSKEFFEGHKLFSNTQTWDKNLQKNIHPSYVSSDFKKINLKRPPANDSIQTKNEISQLVQMKKLRTPSKIKEINDQVYLHGMFDSIDKEKILSFRESEYLIEFIDTYLNVLIMTLKNEYDRVRPSFLSSELDDCAVLYDCNPRHPAYPSGHATQSYFIAHCLIAFTNANESQKQLYLQRAENVAVGREIAGVHYSSDSLFGKEIAKSVALLFSGKNNPIKQMFSFSKDEFLQMLM